MKLAYSNLSYEEKYRRHKKLWPLYVIVLIISYWKLDILKALVLIAIFSCLISIEMFYLKKKIREEKNEVE